MNAKVGDEVEVELETNHNSISVDPYACAIKAKHKYFIGWKNVGHIPREISRHVYFFIKQEGEKVKGRLKSLAYKVSSIPSAVLEVPLVLSFSCDNKWVCDTMQEFVENYYSFEFTGNLVESDNDHEDDFDDIDIDHEDDFDDIDIDHEDDFDEIDIDHEDDFDEIDIDHEDDFDEIDNDHKIDFDEIDIDDEDDFDEIDIDFDVDGNTEPEEREKENLNKSLL